jgi:two-component system response regulator
MEKTAILLVEDNLQEAELTLRALKRNSIRDKVCVVHDGVEAVDFLFCRNAYAARDPDDLPQLILLDLNLPRINGLEVLRILRADARTRLIPVVILTSSTEERDLIESYESGTNSFLHKPVDFDEFVDSVRQVALYWLQLNRTAPNSQKKT